MPGEETSSRIRFTPLSQSSPSGLKSNLVRDLAQDIGGHVWLATDQGLARFDGWETVHFHHDPADLASLSSDRLTAVATTSKARGPVWVGTSSSGLLRVDERTGSAKRIFRGSAAGAMLLSDSVTALAISEDQFLWIGTDRGLNVLNLDTGSIVVSEGPLEGANIHSISATGGKEVWVGTFDGGLYQWNAGEKAFREYWQTTVPVSSVAVDALNRVWIGTRGKGLFSHSPDESREPLPAGFDAVDVTALFVDSNADLWVGSLAGLGLYDRTNEGFLRFRHNPRHTDSLVADQVSAIYEDRSRMLWIATLGGGTSRFSLDRQWFTHVRSDAGGSHGLPHSSVRSFATAPDGTIWIATDRGFALWDAAAGVFLPPPRIAAAAEHPLASLLWSREGDLWLGTRGSGLLRHRPGGEGGTETFRYDPADPGSLGHDNVTALLESRDGTIHVGTGGAGVWLFDPEGSSFRPVPGTAEGGGGFIDHLAEDSRGMLWIAGDAGLRVVPPGEGESLSLAEALPHADRLASSRVSAILPDANGIVWVGTRDAGLDRINLATGEISNYNRARNGLPDDEVAGLLKDDSGFLWVATRLGVARLDAMHAEFRVFSPDDGLQKDGFNPAAAGRCPEGRLYFGGRDGFNIIDPAALPESPRTPLPVLTSFEYFGERIVPSPGGILEKELAATEEVRLPYDPRNRFALRFGSLDYRDPGRGHFRYMLKGHEFDWQLAGDDRKASYSGLPAGAYTFTVQSSQDGREWPDLNDARVRIRITPPWWQTWWFRVLASVLLVFGTVGATKLVIQSRIRQMRRREEAITAQRDKAEAALARQLQNRMLIERTTRDLQNELSESRILNDALHNLTGRFRASHCFVHRLAESPASPESPGTGVVEAAPDRPDAARAVLKQIGRYAQGPEFGTSGQLPLDPADPFVQSVLSAPGAVLVDDPSSLPRSLAERLAGRPRTRLAFCRTSFLDRANGIITLLRTENPEPWTGEEVKLLEALAGQFGLAVAQIDTAAAEESYRNQLEAARHQAEVANRAKSDFLAKMTHELRTPLNSIIGFSEILGDDPALNPHQRETLAIINNSGEHLLDIINEILDLSKIEAGKMERHDDCFELTPMLRSVHEMLSMKAGAKRIGFEFSAKTNLPSEIRTDRSKLRQILVNLLGNAIKFTAQGAVHLSIRATASGEPRERDGRMERRVRLEFEVRDTGRGISEEELPRLFERYSQTESGRRSTEGTGLGLPIARDFIELLDGDIEVSSVLGEGTVFRFHIECDEIARPQLETAAAGAALDEQGARRIVGFRSPLEEIRILIAEDQPTNRLLLKKILSRAGFTLAEAADGREAVAKWHNWRPHLILMDEDMPEMKGNEAIREIRSLTTEGESPVIVSLTAYALDQARVSALEAGSNDFLAKPFRSHELFSLIAKHLAVDYVFEEAA